MQLVIGQYSHALNEAAVAFQKRPLVTGYGLVYGIEETWSVSGFIQAADQASLLTALNTLEIAYQTNGVTLKLLANDGSVARQLPGATTLGNTRIEGGINYPEDGSRDAEFSTFRRYTARVVGVYPTVNNDVTLAWSEVLQVTGTGGPRFVVQQPLTGLPQAQQVAAATPWRAVQIGQAVGLHAWPNPPGPIYSTCEHLDQREIKPGQPKRSGAGFGTNYTEYPIEWRYVFENPVALVNNGPTIWQGA